MSPRSRTWRDMRIEAGLTLRQLEGLSGLNRGEISRIERGRGCASPDQAIKLLWVLQADKPARPDGAGLAGRALALVDAIDGIVDDTHPEGDGCPLCAALDDLRALLDGSAS